MSDFEENDDFMCDDEEDYGLVSTNNKEVKKKKTKKKTMAQWVVNGFSDIDDIFVTYMHFFLQFQLFSMFQFVLCVFACA